MLLKLSTLTSFRLDYDLNGESGTADDGGTGSTPLTLLAAVSGRDRRGPVARRRGAAFWIRFKGDPRL